MLCLPSGTDITWNSSLGGIPFISRLAILGEIDTSDVADPAAP